MPGDRATENAVREVLELMSSHAGESLTPDRVADRLNRPEHSVQVILSSLAAGYILKADEDAYRYERDPVVELDVQRFLRRSGQHSQLVQDNLARFRDRYGYR
jgi:DNA-binding IclR family transcriptional regulator